MVDVENGKVMFSFFRPQAKEVFLVGDFNGWQADSLPMRRGEGGYWKAQMELPQGQYRFRYLADGSWYTDFAAFGVTPGPYHYDSLVRVAAPVRAVVETPLPAAAAIRPRRRRRRRILKHAFTEQFQGASASGRADLVQGVA
jgi:hypothetical protein